LKCEMDFLRRLWPALDVVAVDWLTCAFHGLGQIIQESVHDVFQDRTRGHLPYFLCFFVQCQVTFSIERCINHVRTCSDRPSFYSLMLKGIAINTVYNYCFIYSFGSTSLWTTCPNVENRKIHTSLRHKMSTCRLLRTMAIAWVR
jgi:hypothetical protein